MKKRNKTLFTKPANTEDKQSQCLFHMFAIALMLTLQLSANSCKAQGNLQFNQVLMVGTTTQTVPAGKIWKIESVLGARTSTSGGLGGGNATTSSSPGYPPNPTIPLPADHVIVVGGNNISIEVSGEISIGDGASGMYNYSGGGYEGYQYSYGGLSYCTSLPIWIPATTTLQASTNVSLISVIEFNIVP